jgi:hypothetical protein
MRLRWFNIRPFTAAALRDLAAGMLRSKYDEGFGCGFILGDVRKSAVVGRHIEKEVISRTFQNPLGQEVTSTMESYRMTSFEVRTGSPNLEIVDPSRRLPELLTSIGDLLDNRIAITPIVASTSDWIRVIRDCGAEVETARIVTNSISLSDSTSVRATFVGKSDVEDQVKRLFPRRSVMPDSVSGKIRVGHCVVRFRVGSSGIFRFASYPGDEIVAILRKAASAVATV